MRFYGNNSEMEYDIIVKPGADPSMVKLSYEGIEGLRVTEEGDLEITLRHGKLIQKRPYINQEIDGKKVEVDGSFKIEPQKFTYSFQIASYNKSYPLIIDPVLVYSTYLGGSSLDYGFGIAVDSSGNAYVTGYTYSTNFPTQNPIQGSNAGGGDAFVAKIGEAVITYTLTVTKLGTGTGTVTSSPAGINCGADCSEAYDAGTVVTLTATPDGGSVFAGWSGACSGTNPTTTVTMNADKTCTATFNLIQRTLTVTKAGTGTGTVTAGANCTLTWVGDTGTCTVNDGTAITLSGTADASSTWNGWSGCTGSASGCTGTGDCIFNITADSAVTATFTLNQYTITTSANPAAGGSVVCNPNPVNHGSTSTCTITTNAGYTLQGVGGTCEGTLAGSTYTTNAITADCTVTANFMPPNTPVGQNVPVSDAATEVLMTFSEVTSPGMTTVTSSDTGPAVPGGFTLASQYFDIMTTAAYSGSIEICLPYNEATVGSEEDLKLMHWNGTAWEDVTTSLDTANNVICGNVLSLSIFAVMESITQLEARIDFDPDTLNLDSKGKWVTVYIELPAGHDVSEIIVSSIKLNGVVPAEESPTAIGDYDNDGVMDLMVKFSRSSVQTVVSLGESVITVTGELSDGTAFSGTDTIQVIE